MSQERNEATLDELFDSDVPLDPSRRRFIRQALLLGTLGVPTAATIREIILHYLTRDLPPPAPNYDHLKDSFSEELTEELLRPFTLRDPENGQRLSVVLLNREKLIDGEPLIFVPEGFLADLGDESHLIKLGAIAKLTNLPVLGPDDYGKGESDPLIADQIDEIHSGFGLLPVARSMARTISRIKIPKHKREVRNKRIYIAGYSKAASTGVSLAAEVDAPEIDIVVVDSVFAEPVGVKESTFEELSFNFLHADSPGEKIPRRLAEKFLRWAYEKVDIRVDPDFHYATALGQIFVPQALRKGLTLKRIYRSLLTWGTRSSLCPDRIMRPLSGELKIEFPGQFDAYAFENADHAIFGAGRSWSRFVDKRIR